MDILVDIGNTRIKWAIMDKGDLIVHKPLIHDLADFREYLDSDWRALGIEPKQIALSCVSARQVSHSVMQIAKNLWPAVTIHEAESSATGFGVCNAYKYPAQLGVDRWLGLLAARQITQQRVCIVDCGTALTIDLMDEQGVHLGGVICPGLAMMRKSLSNGTAALPYGDLEYPIGLSDATLSGIYSGTFLAAVGLIEQVLARQPKWPQIILTGGDAPKLAAYLDCQARLVPDLILMGLGIFLRKIE